MNNKKSNNYRQVPVHNKTTGEVRMSKPMPQQGVRFQEKSEDIRPANQMNQSVDAEAPSSANQLTSTETPPLQQASNHPQHTGAVSDTKNDVPDKGLVNQYGETVGGKSPTNGKAKNEIETLEQLLAYAYTRKGKSVKINAKAERLVSQSPALDAAATNKLLTLARADLLLAVPPQLMLLALDVKGSPRLRDGLSSAVFTVVERHPVFADKGVQAVFRNLPDAPPTEVALKRIAGYTPPSTGEKDDFKPADIQALRLNASKLLATWLAIKRSLRLDDLAKLLFQCVWEPAARELGEDSARIRALVEVEQLAGVGLACDKFRQNAIEALSARDQAYRDASILRETESDLRARLMQVEQERDALTFQLQALQESSTQELAETRRKHEVERTHLQHDHEQLRGRLVRQLSDSIEMLGVGLSALRNKTPRTEVMLERAEHVMDVLRAAQITLKDE